MSHAASQAEIFWLQRVRKLRRLFNRGWWLHYFLRWSTLLSVGFGALILWARSENYPPLLIAAAVAAGFLAGAILAWLEARPRFISEQEALQRLEVDLALKSRLTSAQAGVAEWPTPPDDQPNTLGWNYPGIAPQGVACLAVIAIAFAITIPRPAPSILPARQPESWEEVAGVIESLRQNDLVEEIGTERIEQALEQLRKLPADQWFSHQGLEAGDSLEQSTRLAADELQRNLELAAAILETARDQSSPGDPQSAAELDQLFQNAIEALATGRLPLNQQLLAQLEQMNPSQLAELSEAQWQQIWQFAEATANQAAEANGQSLRESLEARKTLAAELSRQLGTGTSRGPGEAPLDLNRPRQLQTEGPQTPLPASPDDPPLPSDRIATRSSEPEPKPGDWSGPNAAGGQADLGTGSEATWTQSITPAERQTLRTFFTNPD